MARLAIYASHSTNGVAAIHTEILKNDALKEWYEIYPERFNNKTNGITQRRWLALANEELAGFINDKIGNGWITNLDELKKLENSNLIRMLSKNLMQSRRLRNSSSLNILKKKKELM